MRRAILGAAARLRFRLMRRETACRWIRKSARRYRELAGSLSEEEGHRPVRVPTTLGVDEDMRDWSYFMLLEHNVIVNRTMSEIARRLTLGEALGDEIESFDPKTEVMPSADAGPEQVAAFEASVEDHLRVVAGLPEVRGGVKRHPVCGPLDGHGWHCMLALHLDVHLKQAKTIARLLR